MPRSMLLLFAATAAGCATAPAAPQTRPSPARDVRRPAEHPTAVDRDAAVRELRALGADLEYALNVLTDGTDPPGRIRRVTFPPGKGTDDALRYVGAIGELEHLELHGQPVSDDGLRHLAGLTDLRWLGLSRTRVTGAGLCHLGRLRRLEALFLEGQPLDEGAFRQLSGFDRLRTLRVDGTSLDDARLMLLTPLKDLEYLGAFDTAVTAGGAARFNQVLPHVTVHRFKGQGGFPPRPPATRPTEWTRDMVRQTLLWPHNFLSGGHWAGQGVDHREIVGVLERPLPPLDQGNAERPLFEVIAGATNRTVLFVPALSDDEKRQLPTYRQAVSKRPPPTKVGQVFRGLLTMTSEVGGPRGVGVVGRPPKAGDEGAGDGDGPYLIYTLYITRQYIAVVALPADGG